MTTTYVRPFVFRDSRECFASTVVRDALELPVHVRQCALTVFAKNPRDAWARLKLLRLAPSTKAHRLVEARDKRSTALTTSEMSLARDGAVYAYPNEGGRVPIVAVTSDSDSTDDLASMIGYFRIHGDGSVDVEPTDGVTNVMLDAALSVFDLTNNCVTRSDVRRAIAAALRQQWIETR